MTGMAGDSYVPTFKCLLIGDGGIGKTTFIRRHISGVNGAVYAAATIMKYPLIFNTTCGQIKFNVYDTSECAKFGELRDGYYINGNCAILMFDISSRITYKSVHYCYRDIVRVCGNIPIVLCGNKVDINDPKVKNNSASFHRKEKFKYFDLSAKANYNFKKPFLWMARKLIGDRNLEFIQDPILFPPDVRMSYEWKTQIESVLEGIDETEPHEDEFLYVLIEF